ncbi:MAG: beta-lactamase family protein, partial [Anaerolineae bacterium]|nr:beta-lactamase family protein [Anaerolineae bacterium]
MNVHSLERFDAELDAYAAASRPPLSSVLVSYCGNIVSEHYWGGQAVTSYRPIFSVTKSVVSALIGLALADGKLTLTDTLAQWFPEMDFAPGSHAVSVTIQHLLTMTSGFEKLPGRVASEDRLAVLLRRRSDALAGETFHYLNEDIDLLIAILERATGESAIDYAYRRLFTPLGLWSDVP